MSSQLAFDRFDTFQMHNHDHYTPSHRKANPSAVLHYSLLSN